MIAAQKVHRDFVRVSIRIMRVVVLLLIAAGLPACHKDQAEQPQMRKVTYAQDVEPILKMHCTECHTGERKGVVESGLRIDSYESLMKGSRLGSVIKPGSALTSSLYLLVSGHDELSVSMPHGRTPLSTEEVETIRIWIDNGALEN
jgi:hypothetical protein